jgi:ribonuclease HI
MNKQFFIFTDGSAIGNPGPAGWAAIVIHGTRRQEITDPSRGRPSLKWNFARQSRLCA